MNGHVKSLHVERATTRGLSWHTRCTCGWTSLPTPNSRTADSRFNAHIALENVA